MKRRALTIYVLVMLVLTGGILVNADAVGAHTFDWVGPSNEGLREVWVRNADGTYTYGYIDEEGNQVIALRFDSTGDFIDGRAIVLEDGRWKQIDREGNILQVFDEAYSYVHSFDGHDGVASNKQGKSAIIGADGRPRCEFAYRSIIRYSLNPSLFLATKDPVEDVVRWQSSWSKYCLLSSEGVELTPFIYQFYGGAWDGSYPALFAVNVWGQQNGHGYLDENGDEKIPLIYDGASSFHHGRGFVRLHNEDGSTWKEALVDVNGFLTDFIFDNVYGLVEAYHEGYATVEIEGKRCLIDRWGEIAISDIGQPIGTQRFEHGYLVCEKDGQEYVIENPLIKERDVNIYVDGNWLYADVAPVIVDGRTLAPLRTVTEALGYSVKWDAQTGTAIIQDDRRIIHLPVGSDQVRVNTFDDGVPAETVQLDVPAQIVDGRTLVPVRFLAENIGAKVTWDDAARTIDIRIEGI